jgi:outer membrane protein assembly factor BamB
MLLVLLVGYCGATGAGAASEAPAPVSVWPALYHDAAGSNFNPSERVLAASNVARLHRVSAQPGSLVIVTPAGLFESIDNGSTPQGDYYQVVQTDSATSRGSNDFTYSTEYLDSTQDPEPLGFWRNLLLVDGNKPPGLKALSLRTGRPVWRRPEITTFQNFIGQNDFAVAGGVIFSSNGSDVSAVDAHAGHMLWQDRAGGLGVIVAGGRVYTGASEAQGLAGTRVDDARTGALLCTLPWTGLWTGDDRQAFALAGYEGSRVLWPEQMVAVNAAGKRLWSTSVGKIGQDVQPVLAYDTLFTVSNRFHPGVTALDAATGRIRWADNLGRNLVLAAANHLLIVLHTDTGRLDVLDSATGRSLARIAIRGYSLQGPYSSGPTVAQLAIAGGTVYATGGGRIFALRP